MTNETTASQPKSIGDDAQFPTLLGNLLDAAANDDDAYDSARAALVAMIDSKLAQASATIQAAPDKWHWCPECGSDEIHYEEGKHKQCAICYQEWFADIDYSDVVRQYLAERKSLLAATIQEPVMVAEPKLTADEQFAKAAMVELAWMGTPPEALRLAAQVFGIAPCPKCDFYAKGCKCPKPDAAPMVADPAGVARNDALDEAAKLVIGCDKRADLRGIACAIRSLKSELAATVKAVPSEALEGCEHCLHTYCLSSEICRHCGGVNGTQGYKGGKLAAPLADKTGGGE